MFRTCRPLVCADHLQQCPLMPEATHPNFSGTVQYTAEELPTTSELATAVTIQRMDQYIREDAGSSEVGEALDSAAHGAMRLAGRGATLQLVFQWVKARVRFVTDARNAAAIRPAPPEPWTAEVLIRPVDLLRMHPAQGDCDDFAMLTAAMLLRAGFGAALVTIAADSQQPGMWSHVYALAIDPATGEETAMDTSHGSAPGWEYPHFTRRKVWSIRTMQLGTLQNDGLARPGEFDPIGGAATATPWWKSVLPILAQTGSQIAIRRYATPPVGTYEQSGPGGTTYFRQDPNSVGSFQFPTVSASGNSIAILAAVGVGLFVLMQMGRR